MEYLAVVTEGILYEIPIGILLTMVIEFISTIPDVVVNITCPLTGIGLPFTIAYDGINVALDCLIYPLTGLLYAGIAGALGGTLGYMTNMLMNLICS